MHKGRTGIFATLLEGLVGLRDRENRCMAFSVNPPTAAQVMNVMDRYHPEISQPKHSQIRPPAVLPAPAADSPCFSARILSR